MRQIDPNGKEKISGFFHFFLSKFSLPRFSVCR